MKGRVRLSELAGRREVERESGGEVCMGKECWVGKEGRHAGLCAKSKEMERLGATEKLCLGIYARGRNQGTGTCPRALVGPGPGLHLKGEVGARLRGGIVEIGGRK